MITKKMKKEKQNYKNREYKIISKLHLSGALPLFFILYLSDTPTNYIWTIYWTPQIRELYKRKKLKS